jgi:hypothetical protein
MSSSLTPTGSTPSNTPPSSATSHPQTKHRKKPGVDLKPDVSSLRVFGARAFVHIPDKHRNKLGTKSLVCTFPGYAPNRKAYRLVHRATGRFLVSRDVIFDEGGPIAHYERVVFEHDSADVPGSNPLPSQSLTPPSNAQAPTLTITVPTPVQAMPPRPTIEDTPHLAHDATSHPPHATTTRATLQAHTGCESNPLRPPPPSTLSTTTRCVHSSSSLNVPWEAWGPHGTHFLRTAEVSFG